MGPGVNSTGSLIWPFVFCFECFDRDEVEETHTGHVHLNIEAIEAEQEMGPG